MIKEVADARPNKGQRMWVCQSCSSQHHSPRPENTPPAGIPTRRAAAPKSVATADHEAVKPDETVAEMSQFVPQRRVLWSDSTVAHRAKNGWRAYYASAGASLRSVPDKQWASLANCWVARRVPRGTTRPPAESGRRRVVATLRKLLARGSTPPLHPDAERLLLRRQGLGGRIIGTGIRGDMTPKLDPPWSLAQGAFAVPDRGQATFEQGLTDAGSQSEADFVRLVQERVPHAVRWLTPQPALDALLASGSRDVGRATKPASLQEDRRRNDFLCSAPGAAPFVIEIDGPQHHEEQAADDLRDAALNDIGIQTFRIPTNELHAGPQRHDGLDRTLDELRRLPAPSQNPDSLVWAAIQVHRLVLGLCEAMDAGWLDGDTWHIEVRDPASGAVELVGPYLGLLDALDVMWNNGASAPHCVVFSCDVQSRQYVRIAPGVFAERPFSGQPSGVAAVQIRLDCDRTPCEPLPDDPDERTVIVRSCGVPVLLADETRGLPERITAFERCESDDDQRAAIEAVLKAVFAKEALREGQLEAITEILEGRDCAVLLPTGGGKSMIYQLAGLCMPGVTLVIDPINALIEDQIEGLLSHGIDRSLGITSESRDLQDQLGEACFAFLSPERLQRQQFRNQLTEISKQSPVNIAVVDEAHCVSEWGHDFRTAYLNFGTTLRHVCRGETGPPPLLALTGTASRPVLKDVLHQLGISQTRENSVIRPATFNRPELNYRVVRTQPERCEAELKGELRALPSRFDATSTTFFVPEVGYSGIVFVRTVKGPKGVTPTWEAVRELDRSATRYSGGAPEGVRPAEFPLLKKQWAADFKQDRAATMVATNAFGMGIDKSNIRWVIHYGLPSSIEAFYQEVGRAGRDGDPAWCVWILSDDDHDLNEQLLRTGHKSDKWDDVSTALYFLHQSFPPRSAEQSALMTVYDRLSSNRNQIRLAVDGSDSSVGKRALHRLAVLSNVTDYTIEGFGKDEVTQVRSQQSSPDDIVEGLLSFVERSAPGRLESVRSEADQHYPTVRDAVEQCGKLLIDVIYDTVMQARLRSLREMWLVASEAESDGEALRDRILAYLNEGDISRRMEELADQPTFSFDDWLTNWVSHGGEPAARSLADESPDEVAGIFVSESDTQEWRSAAARLLGSFPEHPGLLASRGLAEAMLRDGDLRQFEQNMSDALTSALELYETDRSEVEQLLAELVRALTGRNGNIMEDALASSALDRAERDPYHLAAGLLGAVTSAKAVGGEFTGWLDDHWHQHQQLAVLKLAQSVEFANDVGDAALAHYEGTR
ncbi:RecQ family ATP-dependent DNA helicase [Candidatus Poriferisodalis sp.]|uniref:RecQ family ATP-dependent DNA helicase n=1 Tax=Candidatus Poriferisodalis sp. TaxID=3101277 RepID=UPI003B5BA16C